MRLGMMLMLLLIMAVWSSAARAEESVESGNLEARLSECQGYQGDQGKMDACVKAVLEEFQNH